jgi:ribosomal protein L10
MELPFVGNGFATLTAHARHLFIEEDAAEAAKFFKTVVQEQTNTVAVCNITLFTVVQNCFCLLQDGLVRIVHTTTHVPPSPARMTGAASLHHPKTFAVNANEGFTAETVSTLTTVPALLA